VLAFKLSQKSAKLLALELVGDCASHETRNAARTDAAA
jgi:hypothetical protein